MSKILIPYNNSAWGVIVHPQAENEYEHVLSFDSQEIKEQFIGQELFNDRDFNYITEIENSKNHSFIEMTSTSAVLSISLESLNEGNVHQYTMTDLLNVDCIFVKENDVVELYAVDSADRELNQEVVNYTLSKDVLFNAIDELELEGDVFWQRGHTKRHNGTHFLKENNRLHERDLGQLEPDLQESIIPLSSRSTIENILSDITWAIVSESVNYNSNNVTGLGLIKPTIEGHDNISRSIDPISLPYTVHIGPLVDFEGNNKWDRINIVNDRNGHTITNWGSGIYGNNSMAGDLISIKYVKGFPIYNNIFLDQYEEETDSNGRTILTLHVDYDSSESANDLWRIEDQGIWIRKMPANSFKKELEDIIFNKPINTTIEDPREIENEVKLHFSQFNKKQLISKNMTQPMTIPQEYSNKGSNELSTIETIYNLDFTPSSSLQFITVKNNELQDFDRLKLGLFDGATNDLPWAVDAYNEYMTTNKAQDTTSWVGESIGIIGKGITGTLAGAMALGGAGALGIGAAVAGGVIGVGSGVMSLGQHGAKLADLKNAPSSPSFGTTNFIQDQTSTLKPSIISYIFNTDTREKIYDYLYRTGYELQKFAKWEDFKNTRYYFNFIQTGNIFSLIKNRWSADIKQTINSAFTTGFTIWHVRDLDTWKGIANYEYENLELDLVG